MSGAVFNSRFLTRLLTSGEVDFEQVPVPKEGTSGTDCELKMFTLSIY